MPVVIKEIVSEITLDADHAPEQPDLGVALTEEVIDSLVRRVSERVLAQLRLEWEE